MKRRAEEKRIAERRLRHNMAVLLVVSVLAVMTLALVRGRRDDSWRRDALTADSMYAARDAARKVRWRNRDSVAVYRPRGAGGNAAPRILHIELNGADSAELCRVYGIGPVFSARIVRYRERLGGFADLRQLTEVKGVTAEVYEKISPNFWIDSARITKIDINFATREQLLAHPYVTFSMASRIVRGGEMKGGFGTLNELIENDILLPGEARRLAPYLSFEIAPCEARH